MVYNFQIQQLWSVLQMDIGCEVGGEFVNVHQVRGSSVGIATELRAERSGIESRWGRDFPPVQTGPVPHLKWVPGLSPGVKCGRGVLLTTHPPYSAAAMEE